MNRRIFSVLYIFICFMMFGSNLFATNDYRLYQENLGDFSRSSILQSFMNGLNFNYDRLKKSVSKELKSKTSSEESLDLNICDENYRSGIRIFKVYSRNGSNPKDILGFVIVSYDRFSNILLTPVFIRSNLMKKSVNEDLIVFNLVSSVSEFLESPHKISIPYSWLTTNQAFKRLIENNKNFISLKYVSEENDMLLLDLKYLDLKELKLKEPYNVAEIPLFSLEGEKILNEILLPETLTINYKFNQFKKIDIRYKVVISILEKIEELKQKVYESDSNRILVKKEPSILNYLKIVEHIDEESILEYSEMLLKENFDIRKIYELIRFSYFEEGKKEKIIGMNLFVELFPFFNKEQELELQKLVLRNDEFLSIMLWDIEDIQLKKDALIFILWVETENSKKILLKIFDKYKGVDNLKKGDVEVLLTVLDFINEKDNSIEEVIDIIRTSLWQEHSSSNSISMKKIFQKIDSLIQGRKSCQKKFM